MILAAAASVDVDRAAQVMTRNVTKLHSRGASLYICGESSVAFKLALPPSIRTIAANGRVGDARTDVGWAVANTDAIADQKRRQAIPGHFAHMKVIVNQGQNFLDRSTQFAGQGKSPYLDICGRACDCYLSCSIPSTPRCLIFQPATLQHLGCGGIGSVLSILE